MKRAKRQYVHVTSTVAKSGGIFLVVVISKTHPILCWITTLLEDALHLFFVASQMNPYPAHPSPRY